MKKWITLFIIINILSVANIKAQQVQINVLYLQGIHYSNNWDLYKGGAELSVDYTFPIKNLNYSGGIAFRTVQWGTQMSLSLGVVKPMTDRIELGVNWQNGMALFHSRKLYVFGGGVKASYLFLKKEKLHMGIYIEVRYTACPTYKNYSNIYTLTEIPMGLFIRF